MSYLATALTKALADLGLTQAALAEQCSLPRPQINRAARGRDDGVGIKTAEAISRALPEPHDALVLVGWLKDQLSADRAHLVEIHPITQRIAELPAPASLPPMDAETTRLILWIAQMAARHTAVRDSLKSLRDAAQLLTRQEMGKPPEPE